MSAKTLLKSLVKRSSRKAVVFGLFGLGSFTVASPSFAVSVNLGSFARSGDVGNVTPSQATLTNAASNGSDDNVNPNNIVNVSGIEPTFISNLESFLGVSQGTLGPDATEGSAIRTAMAMSFQAGDIFSFDSNFVTNDNPGSDRAFVTIGDSVLSVTGPRFEYTFPTAGSFNIGIGVVDAADDVSVSSRLVVSNADIEPVPEPLTILGSLTALGFGAGLRQRFRKKA